MGVLKPGGGSKTVNQTFPKGSVKLRFAMAYQLRVGTPKLVCARVFFVNY